MRAAQSKIYISTEGKIKIKLIKNTLCVLMSMLLLLSSITPIMADSNIKVKIDGKQIGFDVPPQSINDRTMVPLRAIFEALGASVDWDNKTQTVTSTKDNTTIILTINHSIMYVNGKGVTLDSPACLVDGRTFVPVRAISEAFELKVEWDKNTHTVLITSNSVNSKSFRVLSNVILREGSQLDEDESRSIFYQPDTKKYSFLMNYNPEDDSIYIYLTYYYSSDIDYSVIIVLSHDNNPSVLATTTLSTGEKYEMFGFFSANGQLDEINNSLPQNLRDAHTKLLNSYFRLMDVHLQSYSGITFADLGMYYEYE